MVSTNCCDFNLSYFSLAFYPAFNPKPKDLPIAIVNNDEGTTIQSNKVDIGKKIEDKLLDSDSDKIKWVKVDKESDLKKDSIMRNIMGQLYLKRLFKNAMSKTQKLLWIVKSQR